MPKNKFSHYKTAICFLWQTIKPHKKWYITASVISLMLVGIGLFQARLTGLLIDNAKGGNLQMMMFSLAALLALIGGNTALSYASGVCVSKLAAKAGFSLKCNLSESLLRAKYSEMQKLETGDTLQTINADTAAVCAFIGGDLIGLFSQFTMAIGALIYVLCINPMLALITFAYTPIGMFFTLTLNKKMNALYPVRADSEGKALSVVEQVLSQIPVIKSFMAEKQMRKKIAAEYKAVYQTDVELSKWNALMQPACSSTSMVPRIAYLIFAGFMAANGMISVGVLLSVFDLLNFIVGPTVYMPFLLNGLNRSIASINRIARVTKLSKADKSDFKAPAVLQAVPYIKLCNVSFSYLEKIPVLSNISFEHAGTGIIAICGKSGSGKTTLFDLITGLYAPDSGTIITSGKISVVTQDTYLFDESIEENVRIANLNATDEQVKQALLRAGADKIADASELSGGEKQRISLARTILSDALIWLLDEPTSALDLETERLILNTITTASKEKLILISAHGQSLIDLAERRIDL